MARIALNCSCGWNFFIPGSTVGHEVTCPSCGQTVRIPGRKPGQPVPTSAGAIAAERQRAQRNLKLMVGLGVAGVIAAGVIIAFSMGSKPPEETGPAVDKTEKLTGFGGDKNQQGKQRPKPTENTDTFTLPPPPPPPPPAYNPTQIQELRHDVLANVWMINMTVLLSEVMRYRNLTNEWAQFQADISKYDGKIKYNLGELAKVGEKLALEAYLQLGDQVLGFVDKDFTTMKPVDAATYLATWIQSWRAGPTLHQTNIARGDKKMSLFLEFPEETKELLALVRHPAIGDPGTPGSSIGELVGVPPELLKDINSRFDSLPKGYRSYLVPSERKKLEDMTATRRGSSDDVDWLRNKLLAETIPSFQREADTVRSKVLELEPKLKENVATDVIFRKKAPPLECQIIQETDTFVKVKSRFGSVTIQREDIEKIEKGKGSALEFPVKYDGAKGNLDKLVPLLAWCTEKGLKLEKEYVAYNILMLDASNEKARLTVGLSKPVVGPALPAAPPKYPELNKPAKIEGVDNTVELIANDVTNRNKIFADVVLEMRRRTETLTSQVPPLAPEKSIKVLQSITNPLTFQPSQMTGSMALDIGTWWSGLSTDDRRQFAKYYGLWCAYTRGLKK